MNTLPIKPASIADRDSALATMLLAFAEDPMARWAYPDPAAYLAHFPALVRGLGGKAFDHGSAHQIDDFAGAALWLPPDVKPDVDSLVALTERTIAGGKQQEIFAIFEKMDAFHPAGPHWYLTFIGVDPTRRGNGHGAALLEHALIPCDRAGLPAYLESSNPRNISLYERHGFELLGTIQAGSSPPLFPMLRKPRT